MIDQNRFNKGWRHEELHFIRSNFQTLTAKEMAERLGRTERAIRGILYRERLIVTVRRKWTPDDEIELENLIEDGFSADEIAQKINRSYISVTTKMSRLGLYQKG